MQGFRLQEEKPEVKAWTDLISLKNIPQNKKETERLKQFEGQKEDEHLNLRKKILQKKSTTTLGGDQRNSQGKGGKAGSNNNAKGNGKPGTDNAHIALLAEENIDAEFL